MGVVSPPPPSHVSVCGSYVNEHVCAFLHCQDCVGGLDDRWVPSYLSMRPHFLSKAQAFWFTHDTFVDGDFTCTSDFSVYALH